MGLTGDFARIKKLRRTLEALGKRGGSAQTAIAKAVGAELRLVVREQFDKSVGPEGDSWQPTKRGKPALRSRKLGSSFSAKPMPGGVRIYSKISWLEAHHEGHTFPPRRGGGQWLRYGRTGRLISFRKFLRATRGASLAEGNGGSQSFVKTLKSGRQKFAASRIRSASHAIGQRVLPRRRIFPVRAMPPRWASAIERGAERALRDSFQRQGFSV